MAYVPDVAVLNFYKLTAAEIKLYCYYCKVRNKDRGGWEIDDRYAGEQIHLSRTRVYEARKNLESKGWIKIMYSKSATRHFIAPFFGFFVENSTENHDSSTNSVENPTFPLKELPAPLPAQLTSEGAKRARHAQPDKKSKKSPPAGKPAVAAPAKRNSSAPRPPAIQTPADVSIDHPAVQMVKAITGRFPKKEFWSRISREIGDEPDVEFFRRSFERWRGFNGRAERLEKWLFIPNATGKIPEAFGGDFSSNGNGNGDKPPDVPKHEPTDKRDPIGLDERILKVHLEDFRNEDLTGDELLSLEGNYTPEAWAWLMENLKHGC